MPTTTFTTPATLEAIAAVTHAKKDPQHNLWKGACPICGQPDKLWLEAFAEGIADVRCISGRCRVGDIRESLNLADTTKIESETVRMLGDSWVVDAIVVAHSQPIAAEGRFTNPLAGLLLDSSALGALPVPEPLIENTLDRHTFTLLIGYYGTGKSFLALDWAACIATGTPWMDRPTQRGKVLYVLGEGVHGQASRVAAWQEAKGHAIDPGQLTFTRAPIQLADPSARASLVELVKDGDFDLVIFDTLARSAVGLEENSAKDMGILVAAADEVRLAMTQGSVLMVHHTGKDKGDVRGSSALGGASDTVYLVKGDGKGTLTLDRQKRKDGPRADFLPLALKPVGDSVVVVRGEHTGTDDTRQRIAEGIREYLRHHGESTKTDIREGVTGQSKLIAEVLAEMVNLDLVAFATRKYDLTPTDRERALHATLPPLGPISWGEPDLFDEG